MSPCMTDRQVYGLSPALFMVWFSLNDPVAAIDLLQQNDPHQLMGKVILEKLSL